MKKEIKKKPTTFNAEIDVPQGIVTTITQDHISMKKDGKEIIRKTNSKVEILSNENKITLKSFRASKAEKKVLFSTKAHINNMIKGLNEGFKYKLQVANVHFPMTVEFDKSSHSLIVKNFLGEKKPRVIKILDGVDVKVNKDIIDLVSTDIEKGGQSAANIEKGTKIRLRDRRVFQDGIFIVERPGGSIL